VGVGVGDEDDDCPQPANTPTIASNKHTSKGFIKSLPLD
jgi:hypothetical protein